MGGDDRADVHEWLARLASGEERPFRKAYWPDLLELAKTNRDDVFVLLPIFFECRVRVQGNRASKAGRVLDEIRPRLVELVDLVFPDEPDAVPGEGSLEDVDAWPKVGLLAHMGYHVGQKDPGTAMRRKVLRQVFQGPIPRVDSPEYMREWGSDGSTSRLRKLAWSIASFANNALKKSGGHRTEAVATWSEDVAWLRKTFYEGHFGFPWPDIGLHES